MVSVHYAIFVPKEVRSWLNLAPSSRMLNHLNVLEDAFSYAANIGPRSHGDRPSREPALRPPRHLVQWCAKSVSCWPAWARFGTGGDDPLPSKLAPANHSLWFGSNRAFYESINSLNTTAETRPSTFPRREPILHLAGIGAASYSRRLWPLP